jgi:hypothetical protein
MPGQALVELGLDCGSPGPPLCKSAVQRVMELDWRKLSHHYLFHDLPKGVKETNPTIIDAPLWKEDDDFPFHLLGHAPLLPNGLHRLNEDAPLIP